ncbi:metallophosphoesterase [Halosimplex aquaticum]|uniref:Metallophosphoesterase n=1 Tax=Halosimplex aquaticum TaxID=3026162 RepID=A0ABD5XVU4_9EURY
MLVFGDAHAADPDNRRYLLAAYEAGDADRALHVGDLEHYDLPVPTWFVAGNNEDFDVIDSLRATASDGNERESVDGGVRNVHLLAGQLAEVDGLTVLGLSGNFAPTKYDCDRGDLTGGRRRHFTRADVERAIDSGRDADVDVLLTHEAPHGLISYGYDPGSDPVDELIDAVEPALCLVGHHHRHAETTIGESRVVALAPVWESYYDLDTATLALERFETPDERE